MLPAAIPNPLQGLTVESAKLNGHDPYAYLRDVLTRPPMHKAADIDELRPHRWQPATTER